MQQGLKGFDLAFPLVFVRDLVYRLQLGECIFVVPNEFLKNMFKEFVFL